jgi:hypothetical protein
MHLGQERNHHQDQADSDRNIGGTDRNTLIKSLDRRRGQLTQTDAQRHGEEKPQGQVVVEGGELTGNAGGLFTRCCRNIQGGHIRLSPFRR